MELGSLKLVEGGAAVQTAKALEHLATLLEASGSSIEKVVKTTILLADMSDYGAVNEEYKKGNNKCILIIKTQLKQYFTFEQFSPIISRRGRALRLTSFPWEHR